MDCIVILLYTPPLYGRKLFLTFKCEECYNVYVIDYTYWYNGGKMKLSQIGIDTLLAMPTKEKINFIFNGISCEGRSCEYALLLGAPLDEAWWRALYAAKLYNEGRIKYIIPSGGVVRDNSGEQISECDFMARILRENGVPESAIITENNALTTRENMIFGALMLNRATKLVGVGEIMIVTSAWHMKRSLALAKCFLPRNVSPIGASAPLSCDAEIWVKCEKNLYLIDNEIRLIKKLVDNKIIDDAEFFV